MILPTLIWLITLTIKYIKIKSNKIFMHTKTKAILTLMIISPLLAEVLTNSTPITSLINPVSLFILFFAYSIPILILREVSVRWKTGILGLFLMGFAYGLFNEAILAKTILLQTSVPVPTFDNFGFYLGVNFPWLIVISS